MLADVLLATWVIIGIFAIGLALLDATGRWHGVELIGFGVGAGVIFHGAAGLAMGALPHFRVYLLVCMVAAQLAACVLIMRGGVLTRLRLEVTGPFKIALSLWPIFVFGCLAIARLPIQLPADTPDGMYIMKQPWLNVRIQRLTELPADNYIPYAVTEFLLRRTSFRNNHPILPGEEVTGRPILMSLVAVPFRAALAPPPVNRDIGKFSYVGQQWANTPSLFQDNYYRQFLVVGIVLNSLLLLGLMVMFAGLLSGFALPVATLCAMTSTFVLSQTIFLWPKSFAAFYLVLALHAALRRYKTSLIALCLVLAYYCHPFAITFVLGFGLYYLIESWRERNFLPSCALPLRP